MCSSSAGAKFRSGYFAELISYVTEALPESDANLQVCRFSLDTDYLANPELLPPPVRNNTVNRIPCVCRPNVSFIEALRLRKVAIVYLCKEVVLGGITSVLPDYAGGASAAIEYFLAQGHRHIAVGAGPLAADDTNILKQRSGIVATLEKHKLELSNDFIYFSPLTIEGGRTVLDQILKNRRRPTALYCANDAMAMGAILQAKEHNLRVPEDLSVIGFDDARFASAFTPPLTTVHVPLDEIACRGVEECNKIAQEGESRPENPHQTIVLPTKLVERKSTTAPA
ncbi:MAG: LacI family DNA-binding transcriptional regulator [Chthoniobacteraceae bacterium]